MRRLFLVLVAISVAITALPPAPPAEARSLLGFLGLRIGGGHHAHRHYGPQHTRWARSPSRSARAAVPPAAGDVRTEGNAARVVATPSAPPYWPRAYDDLVAATFATAVSDKSQFWNHGFNDIFAGILAPPEAGQSRRRPGGEVSRDVAALEACKAANTSSDGESSGLGAAAFRKIEQRLAPTQVQQADFDELRAAMIKADQRINSGCWPPYVSASPPERLQAIAGRLWALRQAMLILRTPLEKVYDSLSDAQKTQL